MFKSLLLAAATSFVVIDAAAVDTEALKEILANEAQKAQIAEQLAILQAAFAKMQSASTIKASALSVEAAGSGSGKGSSKKDKDVGTTGSDQYDIDTLPPITQAPVPTQAPTTTNSTSTNDTAKATPAPSATKSAAVTIELVAPVALAAATAAFTLL